MRKQQVVIYILAVIILAGVFGANTCNAQEAKTFPVSGKVLMPDGAPAVGAAVEARESRRDIDWRLGGTAVCGADGKFTMQLAEGIYRMCAVSGEFVSVNDTDITVVFADGSISNGSVSKPIEIRMEKGCKVEGSVVDISNGQPVGGVKIITRDGDSTQSGDDGKWSMILHKGGHTITAIRDGYWWPIMHFNASGDTVNVKVEIKPGGTIKGRVVDEKGQPIAHAWIGTENSGSFRCHGTRTDAEGRFTLQGQDPDSKLSISASADGYDRQYDQPVTFPAAQKEAQVDLTLFKTKVRTFSGRVTRMDGTPVEDAKVAYGESPNMVDYVFVKTDKDGKYTLINANFRKNILHVKCPGLAPIYKVVEADKDVQLDFQMKPGHTIEGRVEDENGNPIEEASLLVSMEIKEDVVLDSMYDLLQKPTTGKDGKFKLHSLPDGAVYVYVYAKGYEELRNERLKVDRKDYTLVLRKTVLGQICGTVLRESDGKPMTEFNVRLDFSRKVRNTSGITPGLHREGLDFQKTDGKFSIKGLKVKEGYKIDITAPGYMMVSVDPVMVKPVSENACKDVVVRLRPASPYEGSITEAGTGKPIKGVLVTAWDTSPFGPNLSFRWDMSNTSLKSVSTRTDAGGKFRFDSMPFSSGALQLEKQGFARTLIRDVKFSSPLQANLGKAATITGSIADEQGKVQPGVWLNVWLQDLELEFKPQINPNGSFKLEDLPPGEYMVMEYKSNRSSRYKALDIKAGETYQVDWAEQGPVVVEGKVTKNGKPVPNADISVNSRRAGMNWEGSAKTAADGSYKLSLLKQDNYSFRCMLGEWSDPNRISSARTAELKEGVNKVDFKLPCGSISGKLVDKVTGKPLADTTIRMYVRETDEQRLGKKSSFFGEAEPLWLPESQCKTDRNGVFKAQNLRAGKWMICAVRGGENSQGVPAGIVKLDDGEAKSGVVAKAPRTGSALFSIAGMKCLPKDVMVLCVDDNGMVYYPKFDKEKQFMTLSCDSLPVGKLRAFVQSNAYLPTYTPFQVKQDETVKVSLKVTKEPRIVFRVKNPRDAADSVSFAYRITTPDGKPVLQRAGGLHWGGVVNWDGKSTGEASVAIKPGTYLVKAAVRSNSDSWYNETDITGWSGTVKVVTGKDTVVEVPWEQ